MGSTSIPFTYAFPRSVSVMGSIQPEGHNTSPDDRDGAGGLVGLRNACKFLTPDVFIGNEDQLIRTLHLFALTLGMIAVQ